MNALFKRLHSFIKNFGRRANNAATDQSAILRTLLDHINDGVTMLDADLRLVAWNKRFLDIMNAPRDRIRLGLSVEELVDFDLARSVFDATNREATRRAMVDSFQARKPYSIQYRTADGRRIDVRRRPTPDGGLVSTYTDVTEQVAAQRQADESRHLLEAVMDAAPAMIHVKDRELRYRMVNRQFLDYLERPREQVLGRTAGDIFGEDVARRAEERDRRVLATGKPLPLEEVPFYSEREPLTTWASKAPLLDSDGVVAHVLTIELDMSQHDRAERERRRWLRLFQDAIESLPNGFAIYDASLHLVMCNSAFASLYGDRAEALVGKSFAELAPIFFAQVRSADPPLPDRMELILSNDPYWRLRNESAEVQLKDGRWFLVSRNPTAEGGNVIVRTDITAFKQMEQELRDSEQRFRIIAETHPVPALILKSRDRRLIYASPGFATLYGARLEALTGLSAETLCARPEDAIHLRKSLTEQGFVDAYEMPLKRADGASVDVAVSARPIIYRRKYAILVSILDLTERKKADAELARHREALYQSEKLSALGSLLAGVAHELNNPLSVVVGRAIMLEEKLRSVPEAESISKVRAAAERCARIVKTFLAMARHQDLRRSPVQIGRVIDNALELVGYGLQASGIEVALHIEPALPALMADPDQLHQVFTNLFTNAQHAMGKSAGPRRLSVAARRDAATDSIRIRIGDSGAGIPKNILPRIFDPFFTTKAVGEGTGLGLSVCRGIVEAHGGTIDVNSSADGGTVFEIALPLMPALGEHDSQPRGDTAAPRGRRILIVDDVPEIAEMLGDILESHGHNIEIANSGRTALTKLEKQSFDLILSDLRMPDLDGPGLYAALGTHHPQLCSRLVFITGDSLSESAKRFLDRADRPVIEKPFIPDEVRGVVARALDACALPED